MVRLELTDTPTRHTFIRILAKVSKICSLPFTCSYYFKLLNKWNYNYIFMLTPLTTTLYISKPKRYTILAQQATITDVTTTSSCENLRFTRQYLHF